MHHNKQATNEEHGSVASYVIGFILSLLFTFIPYYLVVDKVLTGNALLLAILGIGVIQMIIQLVFFLHLGRGPKPLYNVVFFFATAGVVVVTIGASLFIMNNLYRAMKPEEFVLRQAQEENIAQINGKETGACTELRKNHIIPVGSNLSLPSTVDAKRCDTISFVNEDTVEHEIAFGTHPDDTSYGGLFEVVVRSGRPEIITLNETGNFTIHDHMDTNLTVYLNVSE